MRFKLGSGIAGLFLAVPVLAAQKPDPFIGTWTLDVARSRYVGAAAPKSQTAVYAVVGSGYHVTADGVDGQGKPIHVEYTANFDGKEYPVTGSTDYDMIVMKRISTTSISSMRKRGGRVVQNVTMTVSRDGNTRTVTTNGVNAAGSKIHTVGVYHRK